MLKICAIGLRGFPNVMGGIESHCENLYPRILGSTPNCSITVIARKPYVPHEAFEYKGVQIVPIWAWRSKYFETIVHTIYALFYARFVVHADIVHLHAIGPALVSPLARLMGMDVVVTHHGADYDRDKWSFVPKAILRLGERCAVLFANRVIVVGNTLSKNLKARYAKLAHKIKYIPNGVAKPFEEHFLPTSKSAASYRQDFKLGTAPYILAVGRLVPEKGFQDLVKAFKKANPGGKLVIAGRSDHDDEFSRSLLANADKDIVFVGYQSGAEKQFLFENASLFVLPSYHEGLPIVALEALGFGLPIVISDIEPNKDIALPSICYFKKGDVDSLAAKLKVPHYNVYNCEYDSMIKTFDWDVIARKSVDVLSDVIKPTAQAI